MSYGQLFSKILSAKNSCVISCVIDSFFEGSCGMRRDRA